jgi:hypothetical protein
MVILLYSIILLPACLPASKLSKAKQSKPVYIAWNCAQRTDMQPIQPTNWYKRMDGVSARRTIGNEDSETVTRALLECLSLFVVNTLPTVLEVSCA